MEITWKRLPFIRLKINWELDASLMILFDHDFLDKSANRVQFGRVAVRHQ